MMEWGQGMHGFWGHGPGGVLMMIFWLFVVVGLVILFNGGFSFPGKSARGAPESPEDILKRRYAKGEIDTAAYEEMRREIRGS